MSLEKSRVLKLLLDLVEQVRENYSEDRFDFAQTDGIVDELLKHRSIRAHYSRDHLASQVWHQVGRVRSSSDIQKALGQWLDALRSAPPALQQWTVIGGLVHVRTTQPIAVGSVSLLPNSEAQIDDLLSGSTSRLITAAQDNECQAVGLWVRDLMSTLGGDCLITTSVSAGDDAKARELAKGSFEEVVACLRFLAHISGVEAPIAMRGAPERRLSGLVIVSSSGVSVAIQESLHSDVQLFPDEEGLEIERYLDLSPSERSDYEDLLGKVIGVLQIPKSSRTNLQERWVNALRWFGEGSIEESHTDAFIKYAISLEALLGQDDPNATITGPLAEKAAFIRGWSSSSHERLGFYKEVKDLYGQRSRIVHSGLSASDSKTTKQMQSLVSDLLSQFLHQGWLHTYKTWQDFAALFDELRFS